MEQFSIEYKFYPPPNSNSSEEGQNIGEDEFALSEVFNLYLLMSDKLLC